MSKLSQLAAYALATDDLEGVSGGTVKIPPIKVNVGLVNKGKIGGNAIGIGGDVSADNGGSVTIVGGNVNS